jgi:LPS O-antigen subunit length determinant protein (WzzB/FepE family)
MSGRKVSQYRLRREREEKMRLVREVANAAGEAAGLKRRVAQTLSQASDGLRSTFAGEVKRAQAWLDTVEIPETASLGMNTDNGTLNAAKRKLDQAASEAKRLQESLAVAFTQKADEMGRRLSQRIAEVEGLYARRQELLALWIEELQMQNWEQAQQSARAMLESERYAELERALAALEADITAKSKLAEAQEEKHQKRIYLLKALRQVCAEMGFEEFSAPEYEREGDRGSRITLMVDTLDKGRISFSLALDGISSTSEIAEGHCFEEFSELSKYLEEQYGIQTEFKMADGSPIPRLIRKGEVDMPSGADMQAEQ